MLYLKPQLVRPFMMNRTQMFEQHFKLYRVMRYCFKVIFIKPRYFTSI